MANNAQADKASTELVVHDKRSLQRAIKKLSSSSRRDRQHAAAAIGVYAAEHPDKCAPFASDFIDALDNKEARTRWECLDVLTGIVEHDSRACDRALPGAEEALFDEENGFVRLSALRFLCHYGATTEKRSIKVWPLVDEAIQCYHGNLEFSDMLLALIDFSCGKLAPEVRDAFAQRVSFDAQNSKGVLGRRMRQVYENLQK